MDIDGMADERKKEIYNRMWNGNAQLTEDRVNKVGEKNYSYAFNVNKDSVCEDLMRIFHISEGENAKSNMSLFHESFHQACAGTGNEITKIATLHSSSLCALLFFYNVSNEHPLVLHIDNKDMIFSETIFEYQNKVMDKGYPSNVDITLLGKYDGHNVILFLESKFSEYILNVEKKLKIKKQYWTNKYSCAIYQNAFEKLQGVEIVKPGENDEFILQTSSGNEIYLEGLKQMVSHYVGVRNFMDGKYSNSTNPKKQDMQLRVRNHYLSDVDTKVYLGTILFEDKINQICMSDSKETYFDNYSNHYKALVKCLNEKIKEDGLPHFTVLSEVLTYKKVFVNFVAENISQFYFS